MYQTSTTLVKCFNELMAGSVLRNRRGEEGGGLGEEMGVV